VGDDLGDVPLLPVLAGELVVADAALDVHLRTLAQVIVSDLGELAEELDPVPLGAFLGVAVAILAHASGGQPDRGDGHAALRITDLRVITEVADENYFVDSTGHGQAAFCWSSEMMASTSASPARIASRSAAMASSSRFTRTTANCRLSGNRGS